MTQNNFIYTINKACALFLVMWICWPWFTQNSGLIAGMFFSVGWCGTAVLLNTKYSVGIDGFLMICYVSVMAMSYILTGKTYGNYDLMYFVAMVSLFFLPYYMCKFYINKEDKRFMGILAIVAIVFIIIGCYTSIKYTAVDPNIIKTISQAEDNEFLEYRKAGIGSFGFVYMLLFATVGIIGIFKLKKLSGVWKNLFLATFGIACVSCIISSNFTTPLLLLAVGSALVFISQPKSKTTNMLMYVSVLIVAVLISRLIGNILVNMHFESSDVNTRMHEIGNLLLGNEAGENISSRFDYFGRSIKCFLKYPILGYNFALFPTNMFGGHSEWIDMFAVYGIVGGVPLLATIIIKLRRTKELLKNELQYPFYGVIIFLFVIFGFIDPFLRINHLGFVMFMFIPCIACIPYVFDKKEIKNENTLGNQYDCGRPCFK